MVTHPIVEAAVAFVEASEALRAHLADPPWNEARDMAEFPCGCVQSSYPECEDRCDEFGQLGRAYEDAYQRLRQRTREGREPVRIDDQRGRLGVR